MKKQYIPALVLFVLAVFLFVFFPVGAQKLMTRGGESEIARLRGELAALKTRLALQGGEAGVALPAGARSAHVYSHYPFNFKGELVIDKGVEDGVAVGGIVLAEGAYVGEVVQTFPRSSLVQTIFDARFKRAVRIGARAYDALLEGGDVPRLTLIPAEAAVNEGDAVYTAAEGAPIGTPVGEASTISLSRDRLFQEAILISPVDFQSLREVAVFSE